MLKMLWDGEGDWAALYDADGRRIYQGHVTDVLWELASKTTDVRNCDGEWTDGEPSEQL